MTLYKTYVNNTTEYTKVQKDLADCKRFITTLNEISEKYAILTGTVQDAIILQRTNQQSLKEQYDDIFKNYKFLEFSLCVLVSNEKKIFISRRHEIEGKDYPGRYQAPGGSVDESDGTGNERFYNCAKREVFEETGLYIENLQLVTMVEGSRIFPDGQEHLYRTAIFFVDVEDSIPNLTEPEKNSEWIATDIDDIKLLRDENKLTDSLGEKLDSIIHKINEYHKVKLRRINRKRRRLEIENSNPNNEQQIKTGNIEYEVNGVDHSENEVNSIDHRSESSDELPQSTEIPYE